MSGSNLGHDMGPWGSTGRSPNSSSSSSSRKGKRGGGGGGGGQEKPKQPQRGLGVAQLEKIRLQSEMADYFHRPAGLRPPAIHRTGSVGVEADVAGASTSLPSSPSSSSFLAGTVSPPFPTPNLAMAYGGAGRGDMRYGEFQSSPILRPASSYNAAYGAPHYSHRSVTLPLFEPEESIRLKRQHDRSQSIESTNLNSDSGDPQDLDLELKL